MLTSPCCFIPSSNPRQFDVSINSGPTKRIVFQLYDDTVPKTTRNFRELATKEHGFGYAGSGFHRIIPSVRPYIRLLHPLTFVVHAPRR